MRERRVEERVGVRVEQVELAEVDAVLAGAQLQAAGEPAQDRRVRLLELELVVVVADVEVGAGEGVEVAAERQLRALEVELEVAVVRVARVAGDQCAHVADHRDVGVDALGRHGSPREQGEHGCGGWRGAVHG